KLVDYASSKNVLRELEYWNEIENVKTYSLPVNKEKNGELEYASITFSLLETERLLQSVHQAYHTNINDILLTALGMTLQEWTDNSCFLVHLEGHGREDIGKAINVSRTIGWFTSIYPVILKTNSLKYIGNEIKRTKEMLRKVPNKGIGYGVIKYLMKNDNKTDHSQLPILFNYLGQFDQDINNIVFQPSTMSVGKPISPTLVRKYILEITGVVTEKQLTVRFDFNSGLLHTITVENLAEIYRQNVLKVIEHCMKKEGTEITPSDVGYSGLSISDLETIQNKLKLKLKM
ncbi:non-ribosomal peptide synthetase, partial [Bacillus pseudomycoides]|uniref:condensation domain-containing protein n=1 Tax=Bacillus pseudomycoides TaxID=64104 RepID=UPI000BEC11B8